MINISDLCTGCGLCAALCPVGAISLKKGRAEADNNICIGCMQCVCCCKAVDTECSFISEEGLTDFQRLIMTRHSCRSYKTEAVSEKHCELLQKIVSRCPSAMNQKTVSLKIISDRKIISELSRAVTETLCRLLNFANLWGINMIFKFVMKEKYGRIMNYRRLLSDRSRDRIFFDAPCLALVTYKKGSVMGAEDGHIAAQTVSLACQDMGFGTCYIGLAETLFFMPSIRKIAGIKSGEKVASCFVFGKPNYRYCRHIDFTGGK